MSQFLKSCTCTTPSGTKLHYLDTDTTSDTLLIALHGLGGSTNTFTPLIPYLPNTFRIVLVDFPGFGKSPLADSPTPLSVAGHVADLRHLVSSLQEHPGRQPQQPPKQGVILLGHSLGSIVALQYAAKFPGRVAGLGLLGAGRAAGHIPAARERMLGLATNVREKGIVFAADLATKTNFYDDTDDRVVDPAVKQTVLSEVANSDPEGYAQTAEMVVDLQHVDPDYGKIKCPTVFIAGDRDMISPVDRSRDLSALMGGESWVEVVRSGHQPILEDLDGVVAAINNFLEKLA